MLEDKLLGILKLVPSPYETMLNQTFVHNMFYRPLLWLVAPIMPKETY